LFLLLLFLLALLGLLETFQHYQLFSILAGVVLIRSIGKLRWCFFLFLFIVCPILASVLHVK
jgi:hypothetical protein